MNSDLNQPTISKTSRTIFVGGIPIDSTVRSIASYLSQFDAVEKIQVPKDPSTGILKGYAKAVLASTEGVKFITSQPSHFIGGLKVGILKWQNQSSYLNRKDRLTERKVHIRVPPGISKHILYEYFSCFGKVDDVVLKIHPFTKEQRNFCYVIFDSMLAAQEVVDNSPHNVLHFKLHCSISRNQQRQIKEVAEFAPGAFIQPNNEDNDIQEEVPDEKEKNTINSHLILKSPCTSHGLCRANGSCNFDSRCFCNPTMTSKLDTENFKAHPHFDPSISELIPEYRRAQEPKFTSIPQFNKQHESKFRLSQPIIEESENAYIKPTVKSYFEEERILAIERNHNKPDNLQFRSVGRRRVD
jgi:hypothetical protein